MLAERIHDARALIQQARKIAVLTGAGISTESGIPDFRSPGSLWLENPPVSYGDFINKADARKEYWQTRRALASQVSNARPNAAHKALAELERRGVLFGIITQNFDGLHAEAGNSSSHIVELHGNSHLAACTLCGTQSSMDGLQARIDRGEHDPQCPDCGGYLKSATILFGQRIPEAVLMRARAIADGCDLFMIIGSSLKVSPASFLPHRALSHKAPLIIINIQPTSLDETADIVFHEKAGIILPRLIVQVIE